jgi:membrane protease YdiL (CAAX protease family)
MIEILGIKFDAKLTTMIVVSTLLIIVERYRAITSLKAADRFILYLVIPMIIILVFFREPPGAYGFQLGNWRLGLAVTAAAIIVIAVFMWFLARTPAISSYYAGRVRPSLLFLIGENALDLFGWEFIFRGFLLFGLARYFGPGAAILIQAVPFAIAHIGKPELETLSTIFGGAAFGLLAWHTQSFVYPFLIHWFLQTWTIMVASRLIG